MTPSPAATRGAVASRALAGWQVRVFVATWLGYAGFYLTRKSLSVAKVELKKPEVWGLSNETLATVDGGYLVAYALGQFLWGVLGDRLGTRRVVLAGMAGSVLGLGFALWGRVSLALPWRTLALGVYGLFGFHFLLFIALRHAPPVQANLVNYLWPLGIVLLAPVLLPGARLRPLHVVAALIGFGGAALAILGGAADTGAQTDADGLQWGYVAAAASACVWATYSLLTQRVAAFPTAAVGVFGLASGLLSLACHALLEPAVELDTHALLRIAALGLGPLGGAFYLWDAALKRGDPRQIGLLSFLTPLLSTLGLLLQRGEWPGVSILLAALMIVGAAALGAHASRGNATQDPESDATPGL
jgi:drug/metabolite transporter (DMT)-like permease